MAKKLLGSGSKGRVQGTKKNTGKTGLPGGKPGKPWVDPAKLEASQNAGGAGKMLSSALKSSKSTGLGKKI